VLQLGLALSAVQTQTPDGLSVFTPEQIEWMRDEWFAGMYALQNGRPQPEPEQEADAE
jgi:hypothetical protein